MKKLWQNNEARKNAQKLINELLSYNANLDSPYTFLIKKELSASISKSDKSEGINESWIDSTLAKLNAEGKQTIEDFEHIYFLEKASTHRRNNQPKERWSLFIPFDLETKQTTISIQGKDFHILKKSDLLSDAAIIESLKIGIPTSKVLPSKKGKFIEGLPNYFLKTDIIIPENQYKWKEVKEDYDLIRGIVDFSMHHGVSPSKLEKLLKKDFKKRTYLGLPDLAIAIDADNKLEVIDLISDSNQSFGSVKFNETSEGNFIFVSNIVSKANNVKGSIVTLIADCLRLYGQAMDAIHDHQAFLSLWQLAERISCSDSFGGNSKEIAKRLNLFNEGKLPASQNKYILRELAELRNDIVHKGIHKDEVSEDEIVVLKLNCEMALDWIMHNKDQIKTEELLQEYYSLIGLPDHIFNQETHKLDIRNEVLPFVENERKKKQED